jgi:hypothetical protein
MRRAGARARQELAVAARDRRNAPTRKSVARQTELAGAALAHSADSHERAGVAHEDAAALAEDRGESAAAAEHRVDAIRSRAAAARDRERR